MHVTSFPVSPYVMEIKTSEKNYYAFIHTINICTIRLLTVPYMSLT